MANNGVTFALGLAQKAGKLANISSTTCLFPSQIKAYLTFRRTYYSQQSFFLFHFITAHTFTLRDLFNLRLLHRLHQLLVLPVLLLRQPEIHF